MTTTNPEELQQIMQQQIAEINARLDMIKPTFCANFTSLETEIEELKENVTRLQKKNRKLKARVKELELRTVNVEEEGARDQKLNDLPRIFPTLVKLADRKYHKVVYHDSFVGSEAVDALVEHLNLRNREEAVKIGQLLLEKRVFKHVSLGVKKFMDRYAFYVLVKEDIDSLSVNFLHSSEDINKVSAVGNRPFKGKLDVKVLEARDIVTRSGLSSYPVKFYCRLSIDGQLFKTRSVEKKRSDRGVFTWNKRAVLWNFHSNSFLTVQLYKKHVGKSSTKKAELCIPLYNLPLNEAVDQWYTFKSGKGEVRLSIEYSFLEGTMDDGTYPAPENWPIAWVSKDPGILRKPDLSAFHRCGIADIFQTIHDETITKSNAFVEGIFEHGIVSIGNDTPIEMFIQKNPPGGEWQSIGVQRSHNGKVRFELPIEYLRKSGRYPIRMVVKSLPQEVASGAVFVVESGTRAVCFDIDGTLTVGDQEIIKQLALDTFNVSYKPTLRKAAVSMVRWWYAHGYLPVYLSGRQGSAYNLTRDWLMKQGFPPGLIGHTETHMPTLPVYSLGSNSIGVGVFKLAFMQGLKDVGVTFEAVYGNTVTDILAYERLGMPKDRIYIVGPNAKKDRTVAVGKHFAEHIDQIESISPAPVPFAQSIDW